MKSNNFLTKCIDIVLCKDCCHRGEYDCPMYFEEYSEYEEDGYHEYEYIPRDHTEDSGFCHKGEMITQDKPKPKCDFDAEPSDDKPKIEYKIQKYYNGNWTTIAITSDYSEAVMQTAILNNIYSGDNYRYYLHISG